MDDEKYGSYPEVTEEELLKRYEEAGYPSGTSPSDSDLRAFAVDHNLRVKGWEWVDSPTTAVATAGVGGDGGDIPAGASSLDTHIPT